MHFLCINTKIAVTLVLIWQQVNVIQVTEVPISVAMSETPLKMSEEFVLFNLKPSFTFELVEIFARRFFCAEWLICY